MYVVGSFIILFSLIGVLILLYHFLFWNDSGGLLGARSWLSSFECGFPSSCAMECYFSYTYFVLLVFFVVFDLEVSLLLNVPFGFCFMKNGLFYLLFLLVLGVGYGCELYSGYVRWSY